MIIMLTLIIVDLWADDWDFDFRVMYFSNWGVYLTFVVTVLNLCATFKYKKSLGAFQLKLKNIKDDYERHSSENLTREQAQPLLSPKPKEYGNSLAAITEESRDFQSTIIPVNKRPSAIKFNNSKK